MERKIFRLTESDLRTMIRESISTVMDERFEITDEKPYDDFVAANNNKHLVIFDDDYKNLQDLIDGVKRHELLIHARRVEDGSLEDLRWGLEPQNGEEIRKFYSDSYDFDDEDGEDNGYDYEGRCKDCPAYVFASDDLSWCKDSRNGVVFVRSDGFRRKSPTTMCYSGEESDMDKFYDIEDGEFSEPYDDYTVPIYVEAGDYFSDQVADVVAVLNLNGTVQ